MRISKCLGALSVPRHLEAVRQTLLAFKYTDEVLTWRRYWAKLRFFLHNTVNALYGYLSYGLRSLTGRINRSGSRAVETGVALLTMTAHEVLAEFVLPVPTN